ncbi:MAG: photosystem II reaction center PsbP family protein [Elusimicrobiota bacterium]
MKIIIAFLLISFGLHSQQMKNYTMDKKYFSCKIPSGWIIEREKDKDIKNKIYKVTFRNPKDSKSVITIKYYHPLSKKDYKSFVEIQSKTSDGTLESATEKYEKPKEIKLINREAVEINRKFKDFESIESKSESYWLKEKIIVIPAKKGFYSLMLSAKESTFDKNNEIFEKIISSFVPLY